MNDGKKSLGRLQTKKVSLKEKDEKLLNEIKRIKKLQRGLYKEYEIDELGDD